MRATFFRWKKSVELLTEMCANIDIYNNDGAEVCWEHACKDYGIHQHKNANTFEISIGTEFTTSRITNLTMRNLGITFRSLCNLQQINLGLFSGGVTDRGLILLTTQITRNHPNLQKLSLHIGYSKVTHEGMKVLGYQISHYLVNLRSLVIQFTYGCTINDHGLVGITSQIYKHLNKLKELTLGSTSCVNTSKSLEGCLGLYKTAHPFPELERLTLKFPSCYYMNIKRVKALDIKSTNHLLSKLKHLSLDFSGCQNVEDKCLEMLGFLINKYLVNLKSLKLMLQECDEITDTGIELLLSQLIQNNLDSLELKLCNSNLTDQCFESIVSVIGSGLKRLQYFTLDLSGSKEITFEGLEFLVSTITEKRNNLLGFTLIVKDCFEPTIEETAKFQEMTNHFTYLHIYLSHIKY